MRMFRSANRERLKQPRHRGWYTKVKVVIARVVQQTK